MALPSHGLRIGLACQRSFLPDLVCATVTYVAVDRNYRSGARQGFPDCKGGPKGRNTLDGRQHCLLLERDAFKAHLM